MDSSVKNVTVFQYLIIILFIAGGVYLALRDFQMQSIGEKHTTPVMQQSVTKNGPITPIPLQIKLDERKVALGYRLYHDKRLSHDNSISCASCHDLQKGGTDQARYSTGVENALGGINSPTTFNSGFHFVQFWDGRAGDLVEQAPGPVHNPIEMGSNWEEVLSKLSKDTQYIEAFSGIYAEGMNPDTIVDAIAVFELSLFTPNSRFDKFLRGDTTALSKEEQEGYRIFKEYGCVSCHQGVNMGGNMYQTIGVMEDFFQHRPLTDADLGRYNVTKEDYNRHQFKVPTLRNIAITFPYLHDGSAKTLEDVLAIMWNSQLGRSLTKDETIKIILFLQTLTGEYQGKPLAE